MKKPFYDMMREQECIVNTVGNNVFLFDFYCAMFVIDIFWLQNTSMIANYTPTTQFDPVSDNHIPNLQSMVV
jgi:hypothetical protein